METAKSQSRNYNKLKQGQILNTVENYKTEVTIITNLQ